MSRTPLQDPGGRITTLLLAGSRPGVDPLAAAAGVKWKALVPVAGEPMLNHSLRSLRAHPRIGAIYVLAQEPEALVADPRTSALVADPDVHLSASAAGISQSILAMLDRTDIAPPLLVTTADNVLLTTATIDAFLAGVGTSDVAVAMVERKALLAAYPESRRTWLKFRDGWWSGANLFWLGSRDVRPAVAFWQDVEQDRKKGLKVIGAFGPLLLIGSALRLLSIREAIAIAGRRFGVKARIVAVPQAEACIDVDKPADLELVERILSARSSA